MNNVSHGEQVRDEISRKMHRLNWKYKDISTIISRPTFDKVLAGKPITTGPLVKLRTFLDKEITFREWRNSPPVPSVLNPVVSSPVVSSPVVSSPVVSSPIDPTKNVNPYVPVRQSKTDVFAAVAKYASNKHIDTKVVSSVITLPLKTKELPLVENAPLGVSTQPNVIPIPFIEPLVEQPKYIEQPAPIEQPRPRVVNSMLSSFLTTLAYREPTLVIIDGPNLAASLKRMNIVLDYDQFRSFFIENSVLCGINFYHATVIDSGGNSSFKPLADYIESRGYYLVTRQITLTFKAEATYTAKTNMDVELATDMAMVPLDYPHVKHVILFSGDGDFSYTLTRLRQKGVRSTVISHSFDTSIKLKKSCDMFIELEAFFSKVFS